MLKIINDLEPFFKDCYRRISVREYSRLSKISPPTASKLLEGYKKEGLLNGFQERNFNYYYANKENKAFVELSRIFWQNILDESGMLTEIERQFINPVVILFGSLSKAEAKSDSDMDIAVFASSKKKTNLERFEKALGRKIQLFIFSRMQDVKSNELLNNILNGYKLIGSW